MAKVKMRALGLNVSDLQRSVDFYTGMFDMTQTGRYDFPGMTEVVLSCGGTAEESALALVHQDARTESFQPATGFGRLVFTVPDVRSVCKRLVEAGCPIVVEPTDLSFAPMTIAMAQDPDGYVVELVEEREPSD